MDIENGNIQVFIVSVVGVGVNFKGVKYIVNCGCFRYMDFYVEQCSRIVRVGEFVMLLLIYIKFDVKYKDDDMKLYVSNEIIYGWKK